MTPTPRTDALRLKMAQLGWPSDHELVAIIMASHDQLERELAEARAWASMLADTADGMRAELAAERALADRLADSLKQSTEGFGDRLPCEESCECAGRLIVKANEEDLAAWKEARRGTV